jgi:hypothetical protein
MIPDWARLVDWEELFGGKEDPEPRWLAEPFLERGQLSALYGVTGSGKSLLVQDIAGALATGRSVLGYPPAAAEIVLYLDFENNGDDLIERYRDNFGYTAADLSGRLHYASFPELPPLDSPEGGERACQLAAVLRPALIIVDTAMRTVAGAENSNDTFNDLYKHTLMRLKRAGHTVLRLDHPGKDLDRGQRGGSAKGTDVDTTWLISATGDRLTLTPEKTRNRHHVQFMVQRYGGTHQCGGKTGPLHHDVVREVLTPAQRELAAALDAAGIPRNTGRPQIRSWMKSQNLRGGNDDLTAAIRWRRTSQDSSGSARTADLQPYAGQSAGQPEQTASDLGGQLYGQLRQDEGTVVSHASGDRPVPGPGYDFSNDTSEWAELYRMADFGRRRRKK